MSIENPYFTKNETMKFLKILHIGLIDKKYDN